LDKLTVGLQITFIGMTTVFIILVLINLVLNLMHAIFSKMDQAEAEKAQQAKAAPKKAPPQADTQDNGHLIAVLTAAIAAAGETTAPFRTLSIKSVTEVSSGWKENARASVMRKLLVRPHQRHSGR
jgi:sodium pump decarboxylase gamma subunit